jgi:Ca-activated chloride channel family protein
LATAPSAEKFLRREEAQAVYEAAKNNGQTGESARAGTAKHLYASPSRNILPGEQIKITISYVETLKYEDGFVRVSFSQWWSVRVTCPVTATGAQGNGFAPGH